MVTPPSPWGANGMRLSSWNALKATAQKATRMPILRTAMAAVAVALSRTPRTSSVAAMAITTMAGRLITPPSAGPEDSAAGSSQPNRLFSSSLTYWLQPTATAETDTPYSSSRHQPTRKAVRSPSAAYAKEYELPETGMALPSSAKARAVKMQVIAARTNEITTAGPALATLSDSPTKMPVPTIAPIPKQTSWKRPIVRLRPWPSRSPPDSAMS